MAQTISWMVQREAPGNQARVTRIILTWFLAGGLVGGAIAGVLIAGLARLIFLISGGEIEAFAVAALLVSVAYIGTPLRLWRMPKPQIRQQVPATWRDVWSPRIASFLYAGTLGFGFLTRASSLAWFPLIILTLGLGQWPLAIIALFSIVGFVRAMTATVVPLLGWISVDSRVIVGALSSAGLVAQKLEALVLGIAAGLLLFGLVA